MTDYLTALVQRWREEAEQDRRELEPEVYKTLIECADELSALLEAERPPDGCVVNVYSSGVCARGTRSCEVFHEPFPAAAEAERPRTWQPSDPAPRDPGLYLVAHITDGWMRTAWYSTRDTRWLEDDGSEIKPQPTHYQQLPPMPAAQDDAEGSERL